MYTFICLWFHLTVFVLRFLMNPLCLIALETPMVQNHIFKYLNILEKIGIRLDIPCSHIKFRWKRTSFVVCVKYDNFSSSHMTMHGTFFCLFCFTSQNMFLLAEILCASCKHRIAECWRNLFFELFWHFFYVFP
jgi:hypothetical protein